MNKEITIVVFKDGTYIDSPDSITWEYESDTNWLATIKLDISERLDKFAETKLEEFKNSVYIP